ncbi:MAG: BTAD domain-containing putative transcriptional regulator [Gemmatimonadota bacterium]
MSLGDGVGIDRARLKCDAFEFGAAISDNQFELALELYRGDLLAGLPLTQSPGFERWRETAREDRRKQASTAAWKVADRYEKTDNWISATDFARRAAQLSPDPEQALRRLIRTMDRAGDRAAAIREYEKFAVRMRETYGSDPAPQTQSLLKQIRRRGRSKAGPFEKRESEDARERIAPRSLAVLPFLSMGPGTDGEYLADGIAEDLLTHLSRVSDLAVISRTSVVRYKNRSDLDLAVIQKELGVDVVVEGSVRSHEGRIRVSAQLIDARTDEHLWAEVYERDLRDLFTIQSDLALRIAEALEAELRPAELAQITRKPSKDVEAYELYLEGRFYLNRRSQEDASRAIDQFEQALDLNPNFALAYVALANAYLVLTPAAGRRFGEGRVRAKTALDRALDLDPELGEVHATRAFLRGAFEWDWLGAEEDFRRAIELRPHYSRAHHWYGSYLAFVLRRYEDSFRHLDLALQFDPLSPIINNDLALAYFHAGRPEAAIRQFRKTLGLDPEFWRAHYDMGLLYMGLDRREEGVEHLQRAWARGAFGATSGTPPPAAADGDWRAQLEMKLAELAVRQDHLGTRAFESALICAVLDKKSDALDWLERAIDERSWALVAQYSPVFASLESSSRFRELLAEVGLDRIWLEQPT